MDSQLIERYCQLTSALRPMIECVGNHEKRVRPILPFYQDFVDKLADDGHYGLLGELKHSHNKAVSARLNLGLEEISFPDTNGIPSKNGNEGNSLIGRFSDAVTLLRGVDGEGIQDYLTRFDEGLDNYATLLNEMREGKSKLMHEFWWPQIAAAEKLYGTAWPQFMALHLLGKDGTGGSITYVNARGHTLKGSTDWVLSGKENEHFGQVELLEPAKFYGHWNEINYPEHISFKEDKEDKPQKTYNSVEEVITDPTEFDDATFFVAPKVRIDGISINGKSTHEVPLALNNWFRDNSRVHVSRTPYNPIWDY